MKNSRIVFILFVILGFLGSNLCAMKRTNDEVPGSQKSEGKERKALKQEDLRLPVILNTPDIPNADVEMDGSDDQSDDMEVQELTEEMSGLLKTLDGIPDEAIELNRKLLYECGGPDLTGLSLEEFKFAFANMMITFGKE